MNVLITGGSSGIGYEIAKLLISKNINVINISRSPCDIEGVKNILCDLTDFDKVNNIIDLIPNIDVLINNAGFGISGAIIYSDILNIKKQYELNLFSSINLTNKIINKINKHGKIIFTSSLAAIFSIPFQSFYSSSKAALELYAKALRNELKIFDINVTFIRLGDIKTNFTDNREKMHIGDDVYKGSISKSVAKMEHDERNGMKPYKVAKAYYRIIKKKHVKVKYTVGFGNKLLSLLNKILPENLVNYIVSKIYIK